MVQRRAAKLCVSVVPLGEVGRGALHQRTCLSQTITTSWRPKALPRVHWRFVVIQTAWIFLQSRERPSGLGSQRSARGLPRTALRGPSDGVEEATSNWRKGRRGCRQQKRSTRGGRRGRQLGHRLGSGEWRSGRKRAAIAARSVVPAKREERLRSSSSALGAHCGRMDPTRSHTPPFVSFAMETHR